MTDAFESFPNPLPRKAIDHAVIGSLVEGNSLAPWRTNWDSRSLYAAPIASDEVSPDFSADWQISEYMALRSWFNLRHDIPHQAGVASELLRVAIGQFKEHFADELTEAAACHDLDETLSHTDWGSQTIQKLDGEGMGICHGPKGLWPVERKLANMITFWVKIQPDYTPEMDALPLSAFAEQLETPR